MVTENALDVLVHLYVCTISRTRLSSWSLLSCLVLANISSVTALVIIQLFSAVNK